MKKAGRIRTQRGKEKFSTSVYLDMWLVDAIDIYNWNTGSSRSDVIKELLIQFLQREGYINDNNKLIKSRID